MVIWCALSCIGMSISNKIAYSLLRCVYVSICKSVGCPQEILVGARLEVRCQQCVEASSVDLQLVEHVVTVCQKWWHLCNPWYVWKLCKGSEGNLGG